MKKATIIILVSISGVVFVLPLALLLGFVVIDAVFFPAPSAETLLSQRLERYDYYFAGKEIGHYSVLKGTNAHLRMTIDKEKIPELLKGDIFKVCVEHTAICSDPIWSESDRSEYEAVESSYGSVDLWKYMGRTFEPGEYCATANNMITLIREVACVNIDTGLFSYNFYD